MRRFFLHLGKLIEHRSYLRFQLFLWLVVVLSWISNSTTCVNDKVNRLLPKSPTKQLIHSDRIQSSSYFSCDAPHLLKTTHNRSSNSFAHSQSLYVGLMQVFIWVGVYRKNSYVWNLHTVSWWSDLLYLLLQKGGLRLWAGNLSYRDSHLVFACATNSQGTTLFWFTPFTRMRVTSSTVLFCLVLHGWQLHLPTHQGIEERCQLATATCINAYRITLVLYGATAGILPLQLSHVWSFHINFRQSKHLSTIWTKI